MGLQKDKKPWPDKETLLRYKLIEVSGLPGKQYAGRSHVDVRSIQISFASSLGLERLNPTFPISGAWNRIPSLQTPPSDWGAVL